ncbi:MAG: Crp/Fnr family transcriptional regulator, partial [Candidatus Marinimicrobia bacterium]|nr:Crp/Fnr family transcriptional regulator [Candidatus Neomarinimicrobiota bacterium]
AGAVLRRFRRGSVLFRADEPAEAVWLLRAGRVQLLRREPDGRVVIIRQVQPDDLFAEVALFRNGPYPVTAQAVTAGSALAFPRAAFRECLTNEDFRDAFLASLFERMRYLVGRIRQLSALGVEERLADWLLTQYGARAVIRPDVTKQQLAAQINIAPATLSRLLGRLKRADLLIWQGGVIRVRPAFWAVAERQGKG